MLIFSHVALASGYETTCKYFSDEWQFKELYRYHFVFIQRWNKKRAICASCQFWYRVILLNLDEFGADCPIFTKDVDEGNEIYIEYKGKEVESYCDDLKFRGRGNDILDEYSVCVTPLYFNDDDCAVEIDIKTSFNGVTKHVCKNISYKLNWYI